MNHSEANALLSEIGSDHLSPYKGDFEREDSDKYQNLGAYASLAVEDNLDHIKASEAARTATGGSNRSSQGGMGARSRFP